MINLILNKTKEVKNILATVLEVKGGKKSFESKYYISDSKDNKFFYCKIAPEVMQKYGFEYGEEILIYAFPNRKPYLSIFAFDKEKNVNEILIETEDFLNWAIDVALEFNLLDELLNLPIEKFNIKNEDLKNLKIKKLKFTGIKFKNEKFKFDAHNYIEIYGRKGKNVYKASFDPYCYNLNDAECKIIDKVNNCWFLDVSSTGFKKISSYFKCKKILRELELSLKAIVKNYGGIKALIDNLQAKNFNQLKFLAKIKPATHLSNFSGREFPKIRYNKDENKIELYGYISEKYLSIKFNADITVKRFEKELFNNDEIKDFIEELSNQK